ncbi:MAG: type II toxin-antitoxin system HipA family toxin, partial [Polyangiaceae bacterium]|nr:type II toxin-antitoxin system HipA family toxin [Polyangiaceae bacterium]
ETLVVSLEGRRVGTLTLLPGDATFFAFDEGYVADAGRPVLSQSMLTPTGELQTVMRTTRTRLPPWFSNLLPEGPLRAYLARRGSVHPEREFQLLALLGEDLPGAVRVGVGDVPVTFGGGGPAHASSKREGPLRFSLAGVQLKFSALMGAKGGLTIPASGAGGDWIVKLPSATYPAVPENEDAMLTLAAAVGIDVPEHRLVPLASIEGLPDLGPFAGSKASAVKRFDRTARARVHMEDLAQVFGVFPEHKYEKVGIARIAELFRMTMGAPTAQAFVARVAFVVVTGNGDMHLKNWSLLYPDGRTPVLAPAYDLVSTVVYLPGDRLALNLAGTKEFRGATRDRFRRLAERAALPERETLATVERVVDGVRHAWPKIRRGSELPREIATRIDAHVEGMRL